MSKLTIILSTELVSYKQFHPCICLDTDKVLHADKVVHHYVIYRYASTSDIS